MVTTENVLQSASKLLSRLIPDPDSSCTLFKGYHDGDGYGQFQFRINGIKKNIQAHRATYILLHKVELTIDDVIMHSCDNPGCINTDHLSLGTHATNVADRVAKGRCATGSSNGRYIDGRTKK